jgi:hypothetical protein
MPFTADRVKETTTTTGTGTITLLGAVSQFQAFQTPFPVGAWVQFAIVGQTGTEWEVVEGSLATTTTLTRERVVASSNAGALVSLSAGTKDVFATLNGDRLGASAIGRSLCLARGQAMP